MKIFNRPEYVVFDLSLHQVYPLLSAQDIHLLQSTRTDDELKRLRVYHPKWSSWRNLSEQTDLTPRDFTLNRNVKCPQPALPEKPSQSGPYRPEKNPFFKNGQNILPFAPDPGPSDPGPSDLSPAALSPTTDRSTPSSQHQSVPSHQPNELMEVEGTQVLDMTIRVTAPLFKSFSSSVVRIEPPYIVLSTPWPPAPSIPSPLEIEFASQKLSFMGKASAEGYPFRIELTSSPGGPSSDFFFQSVAPLFQDS